MIPVIVGLYDREHRLLPPRFEGWGAMQARRLRYILLRTGLVLPLLLAPLVASLQRVGAARDQR